MPELDPLRLCSAALHYKWRTDSGMGRRFSLSLFLVTALCLVTLIFTQRLATSSINFAIGRSIQSWSVSEVEIANVTAEIEEVLAEQRAFIEEEMSDYMYPAGKYNVSARSLADLVPELGGRPVRSVILTTWRSGSTFLGDVLNSHPANFYHYEPLLDYEIVQVRGPPLADAAIERLKNLLQCNFSNLDYYLEYGQEHTWLFTHNTRLWDRCVAHPHLCWLPQFLSPFCSLFPFQSMKVVRLRLQLIQQLLADPSSLHRLWAGEYRQSVDETVSMVSDTWSTDVLASDSETIEQPPPPPEPPVQILPGPQLLDVSETASEAWSTDVVVSDSERLTEVDTDDTASVARSDDTARSEVESRGESEMAEEVPVATTFRSLREDNRMVPISPTKIEVPLHPSWNVTGKGGGKADYRRRTVEYVDSNSRDYKVAGPPNEDVRPGPSSEKPPDLKPALVGSTHSIVNALGPPTSSPMHSVQSRMQVSSSVQVFVGRSAQLKSLQASSQEISVEEVDSATNAATVCLSSVSLASTSSSGSSSEPRHKTPELCSPASPLVLNGSVVMIEPPANAMTKTLSTTGAIPKSISFDKTAERGDKESLDEDGKHKRGFFRNFKLPFKNRRGSRREDNMSRFDSATGDEGLRLRRGLSEDSHTQCNDTSEDILAKYRRKVSVSGEGVNNEDVNKTSKARDVEVLEARDVSDDERLVIDPSRVEASYAFADAKKKLRLVLSTADMQQVPDGISTMKNACSLKENELVAFLQMQLAEAINLQDRALIAHLHETLRCIRLFDSQGCRKLFDSLKEDFKSRSPYVAYLVRCRQSLLSSLAHLDRLTERLKNDKSVCSAFLIAVCVRIFLEKREAMLDHFTSEFQQLTLADEKNDLLDSFLQSLTVEMDRDPLWQAASESQLAQGRLAVERAVISRVYMYAMYPNGDGDISRDQVLHEHMSKLSAIITPNHKDLRIPKIYLYECPWPSAQAEIATISAYKTPLDKLQCVFRCATTIVNLLSMACDRGPPAADDLVPVMVFVLIKANPPSLLSTVQYVTSFYANRLQGEEHYWWVQFCSAIEFIKTMDYITTD